MYLVTLFGAHFLCKEEHYFEEVEEAQVFLQKKGFVFDETEEDVQYWHLDDVTFAVTCTN